MDDSVSFLRNENLSIESLLGKPDHWKSSVLGTLCFSADAERNDMVHQSMEIPCMRVPMQRLDATDSFCEIWHGNGHLKQGQSGVIHYRYDDDVLFGVIEQPETGFIAREGKTPLQQATEFAYRQIFALIELMRYPYLFRFWNYIADINGHSFELERYRQFNLGRQDAFLAHGHSVAGNIPAACALGLGQGSLTIAFLAGRVKPLAIENPRQVSAYQYPIQYGPRSPMFARACLVQLAQDEVLFISGTASIVGHVTLHPADVVAQTQETIRNIEAVLTETNRVSSQANFCLADLHYKVYIRHPEDLEKIRMELTRHIGDSLDAVYLQADICRADLLVEIEGSARYRTLPKLELRA